MWCVKEFKYHFFLSLSSAIIGKLIHLCFICISFRTFNVLNTSIGIVKELISILYIVRDLSLYYIILTPKGLKYKHSSARNISATQYIPDPVEWSVLILIIIDLGNVSGKGGKCKKSILEDTLRKSKLMTCSKLFLLEHKWLIV